jgi:hypothetical protein
VAERNPTPTPISPGQANIATDSEIVTTVKRVNALIEDAQVSKPFAELALGASQVFEAIRRRDGGLWVGGTLTLTKQGVAFAPNAMNRLAHVGDTSFSIQWADISSMELRKGFITNIIAIKTDRRRYQVRCFCAARFLERLQTARRGSTGA